MAAPIGSICDKILCFFEEMKMQEVVSALDASKLVVPNDIPVKKIHTYTLNLINSLQSILVTLDTSKDASEEKGKAETNKQIDRAEENDSNEKIQPPSLNPQLVQVRADKTEIERRIQAFITRKQMEVDENNKREFCSIFTEQDQEESCARTGTMFVPRTGGRSHVKVSRVVNQYGPQNRQLSPIKSTQSLSRLTSTATKDIKQEDPGLPSGVDERLANAETHLKLRPKPRISSDVYERLKRVEERILYLESISPEYFSHTSSLSRRMPYEENDSQSNKKQKLSVHEIDQRIAAIQETLKHKQPTPSSINIKTEVMDTS